MNTERISRLNQMLCEHELDCLALVPGANLTYLTGLSFSFGDRPTLAFFRPDQPPALIMPALEAAKVAHLPELKVFPWTDQEGYAGAFRQAVTELGLTDARIGVEAFVIRMVEVRLLEENAAGSQLLPADEMIGSLRMRKDANELALMRRAVELAQEAIGETLTAFRVGMTEREIEAILKIAVLNSGADGVSFGPAVAGGPNTANPHGHPTDRPVKTGDFLLFDWGVWVDGYASDITRTFPVGEMEPEMHTIYELVQKANAAGRAAVRPGVTCSQIDVVTRQVIEDGGYGEFFTHRTGHGLGRQVHEPPFIVEGNERLLEPGMTFTIEPGIYLPGRGGVRIEDDMVVTEQGGESLTTYNRDWQPLG